MFRQFTGEHPCKSVTSTLLKYSFENMLRICSRTPFLPGELLLYVVLNIEVVIVEVLSKKLKNYLKTFQYYKNFF